MRRALSCPLICVAIALSSSAHTIFQVVILLTVIAGIVVEGIATPGYRRHYFQQFGRTRGSWFEIAEASFGFTLFVEFMIKVIVNRERLTHDIYVA